jgi:hypothetical protein
MAVDPFCTWRTSWELPMAQLNDIIVAVPIFAQIVCLVPVHDELLGALTRIMQGGGTLHLVRRLKNQLGNVRKTTGDYRKLRQKRRGCWAVLGLLLQAWCR